MWRLVGLTGVKRFLEPARGQEGGAEPISSAP